MKKIMLMRLLVAAAAAAILPFAGAQNAPSPSSRAGTGTAPDVRTVGTSERYHRYLEGFFQYIDEATPPYPRPPASAGLPALLPQYAADVAYVRSLRRGPYPAVVRGRPAALLPQVQDELQNGTRASLPPGPAWVSRLPVG